MPQDRKRHKPAFLIDQKSSTGQICTVCVALLGAAVLYKAAQNHKLVQKMTEPLDFCGGLVYTDEEAGHRSCPLSTQG